MLHIGVDEAGYGPLLGPLVIGLAAFRVDPTRAPAHVPPADEWRSHVRARLKGIVRRVPRGRWAATGPLPVPVDDSKLVLQRFGLPGLARGVGLFASALDQAPPADLADLVARYSDCAPDGFGCAPWFEDLGDAPLPRYPWTGPLTDRFEGRGVRALDLRVLPVDAPALNDAFRAHGNKAGVLGLLSATLLLSVLDRYPGEDAQVVMDRHGGRKRYGAYLGSLFPFAIVSRAGAPPGEERYRVRLPDRVLRFRFVTQGDRCSIAVGWASMAAKLTRELFMQRLNGWFHERAPGVRPTAGYTTDGRRFLDEVGPVLADASLDLDLLVRSR